MYRQHGEVVPAAILMRSHFFQAEIDLFVLRTGRGMQTCTVAPSENDSARGFSRDMVRSPLDETLM
jgi:hypothetical protein